MAESASAQRTESWVPPSLQLPELARISRPHAEDDLSDAIVRFRGISLRALENIRDRLLTGEAAAGVALLVAMDKLAEGVDAGHTLLRTGDSTGIPAYREGELTFRADQVRAKPRKEWTTADVCTHFVLPLTQPTRCFFLDLLAPEDVGKPFEGAFVSHCWQCSFSDLVDTLLANTTSPLEKSFVWVDNFCANQPLLSSKDVTEDMRELLHGGLHKAIARFDGGMLVVFDSWSNPKPITRAWCMWEVYGAAIKGIDIQIVFAGSEAASVEQWLSEYNEKTLFLRVLSDMDPRKMQCHDDNDLNSIRGAVEAMDGGFSRLKQMITERLTRWLLAAVEDCVKRAAQGAHDMAFAQLLHAAAIVVNDAGHHDVALNYNVTVLAIKRKTLGERHPSVAETLNNMAGVYQAQDKLELALTTYTNALDIKKETLCEGHPSVANTLNSMGTVYRVLGKLDLALVMYEEALAIYTGAFGSRHSSVAGTLSNMAGVYTTQGMLNLALGTFEKALDIMKKELGERHTSVAEILGSMAGVYWEQGLPKMALKKYEEALDIYKETVGAWHSSVAMTLNNMVGVYAQQGNQEQALKAGEEALAIYRARPGPPRADEAMTLYNLGNVYLAQKNVDLALEKYKEAMAIFEKTPDLRIASVAIMQYNMALLFERHRKMSDALRCAQGALEIYRAVYGASHAETVDCAAHVTRLRAAQEH